MKQSIITAMRDHVINSPRVTVSGLASSFRVQPALAEQVISEMTNIGHIKPMRCTSGYVGHQNCISSV